MGTSEPHLPQPAPERGEYWDPHPPRCPECGGIIDPHPPAGNEGGEWVGWCQSHGLVVPVYPDSQESENDEEVEE